MKTLFSLLASVLIAGQTFAQTSLAQAKPVGSDTWGYINPKGEFAIQAQYTNCHAFSADGLAPIYDKKAKTFYFIKPNGEKLNSEVASFKLRNIFGFGTKGFENGLANVQVGKAWGYMNTDGKLVIAAKYEDSNNFNGGFSTVKSGGKWYVIDKSGTETVILGATDAKSFSEGLAPVRIGDLHGFADTKGGVAIEAKFKSVGYFSNGLAWAKTESGQVGFIDKKGNWVI